MKVVEARIRKIVRVIWKHVCIYPEKLFSLDPWHGGSSGCSSSQTSMRMDALSTQEAVSTLTDLYRDEVRFLSLLLLRMADSLSLCIVRLGD